MDVKPWDGLLMSLSKRLRNNVRRSLRRAQADGVSRCEVTDLEDADHAARKLVALHREAWQGRDIDPEHLTRRFETFIAAAARRMTARRLGTIYEFRRAGETIVSGFVVFGSEFDAAYMSGATVKALQHYQWSSLSFWYETDIARANNSACLSLMEGEEPYKLRWASKRVPRYRMILCRGLAFWFFCAGYYALRTRAKHHKWGKRPQR
jgi:hypothetical protein